MMDQFLPEVRFVSTDTVEDPHTPRMLSGPRGSQEQRIKGQEAGP